MDKTPHSAKVEGIDIYCNIIAFYYMNGERPYGSQRSLDLIFIQLYF